jgi:hypothetical protein
MATNDDIFLPLYSCRSLQSRVTRLCEILPIGHFLIDLSSNIFGATLFHGKKFCMKYDTIRIGVNFGRFFTKAVEANPTITNYYASAVKIYNAKSNLVLSKSKNIFFQFGKAL